MLDKAQNFPKCQRISEKKDFEYSKQAGKRFHSRDLFLVKSNCRSPYARLAVVASRKTGNAVQRNFWKRQIREMFRKMQLSAADYVLILKPSIKTGLKHTVYPQIKKLFAQHEKTGERCV